MAVGPHNQQVCRPRLHRFRNHPLRIPGDLQGLCDQGLGAPELGYVRLSELEALRGGLGLPVERDRHFSGTEPLSAYLAAAEG